MCQGLTLIKNMVVISQKVIEGTKNELSINKQMLVISFKVIFWIFQSYNVYHNRNDNVFKKLQKKNSRIANTNNNNNDNSNNNTNKNISINSNTNNITNINNNSYNNNNSDK